jgi:subtilisin family serine protease
MWVQTTKFDEGLTKEGVAYMKQAALLLTVALATTLTCAGLALAQVPTPSQDQGPTEGVIPGQYIVVFKDEVQNPTAVAREHAQRHGAEVLFTYQHSIKSYAARFPERRLDEVRADEQVAYVESDETAYAQAQTLPWGINRIDADVSSTDAGNGSGAVTNVNAYIIDSGIYRHTDLNVVGHVNFAGGNNTDCNGHGTHVAGTVAAKDNTSYVVGAAPGAPLTGVKVLGCNGSGSYSGVIKGVDWVTANARKPAIANMSLRGPRSQALDDAVTKSAASGIFYSIAAGNDGVDACTQSPARAGAGIDNGIATVAATDTSEAETSWSNYGSCVDIWAPGANIRSTSKTGGTTTMSGTSMAAPHAGGGAVLYLSSHTTTSPSGVESALKNAAKSTGTTSKDRQSILREYVGGF